MPRKQVIPVPGLKTIGPYSQAVRAAGLLFVSGQPGINPSTGEAAGLTFGVQARQAFKNLDIVLRAGGSRLELVVNTTVLVTDISNFSELNHRLCSDDRGLSRASPPLDGPRGWRNIALAVVDLPIGNPFAVPPRQRLTRSA